jgi:hypothetical protein
VNESPLVRPVLIPARSLPPVTAVCGNRQRELMRRGYISSITSIPLASQQEAVSSVPYEIIDKNIGHHISNVPTLQACSL